MAGKCEHMRKSRTRYGPPAPMHGSAIPDGRSNRVGAGAAGAQPWPGERTCFPPVSPFVAEMARDGAERGWYFSAKTSPRHPAPTRQRCYISNCYA
jgi:hypothetical protein